MTVTTRTGEKSSALIGRRGPTGENLKDRKDFFPRRYATISFEHDEDSDSRESRAMRARRADSFGERGHLWGSGPIDLEIPAGGAGFMDILHGVLGEPTPVSTPIPDKTLVKTGTNLSAVVADGYFRDTTAVDVDVVDGEDLEDNDVTIVNAQNLSGAGAKTVADDLSSYDEELTLTLTPSSAALTNANTPGTVVIEYTDADGEAQTETLSFATGALTTAQTVDLPRGATISEVTTTGFSGGTFSITTVVTGKDVAEDLGFYDDALELEVAPSNTADLENASTPGTVVIEYIDTDGERQLITLSFPNASKTTAQRTTLPEGSTITRVQSTGWSAGTFDITVSLANNVIRNPMTDHPGKIRLAFNSANAGGKVIIRGLRKVGIASDDTLPLKEEIDFSAIVNSTKYFHKIGKIEVKDSNGDAFSTGTVEITSRPGGYATVMEMSDNFPDGWDIEGEVGGEPRMIRRAIVIGAEIDISNTIGILLNILSKRVDKRKTIEGDEFEEQFVATAETHPVEFPFITERFFTDIGAYLELDGEATVFDSAPINIAHNYDFDEGKKGSPFREDLDPTDQRNVTTTVATSYRAGTSEADKFVRWDEKYRNKEPVSAKIVMYQWLTEGRQVAVIWDLGYCEVTSPVRVVASGPGKIPISVPLKAVPNPETGEKHEIKVTIIGDDRWV